MQPAAGKTESEPQDKSGGDRQPRNRRDETVQLALHQLQACNLGGFSGHRVIDKEARQIEQPGEPGYDHDDMKSLEPEHDEKPVVTMAELYG